MRRTPWILAVIAAIAILAAGCGTSLPEVPQTPGTGTPAPSHSIVKADALPTQLADWKSIQEPPAKTLTARVGDFLYVLVTPTAADKNATAIQVTEVITMESFPPTFMIRASLTMGSQPPAEMPRAYVRIPYPAADPAPGVTINLTGGVAGTPSTGKPEAPITSPPASPLPSGPLTFSPIDWSSLPPALAQPWRESTVQVPGGVAAYADGALYLMVTGGQQPTGGYSVEIKEVRLVDHSLKVSAILHKPKPTDNVTLALTYPKAYARLSLSGAGELPVTVEFR